MTSVERFIYRIGSYDNTLGRPPSFYSSSELHSNGLRFASVYAVRQEDADAIQHTAQTAAGFKGIVWSSRLWIDIDNKEAAEGARLILKEKGLEHVIYDTGNRGCHIGVARDARPSHTLPQQDKAWVQANIPGADLSLYWHLHLLRLPGVLHEKTGEPKKLTHRQEGTSIILSPLSGEEKQVNLSGVNGPRQSIFQIWGVVGNLTENEVGSRHKQLVNLAVALRNDAKVTIDEAMWVVGEVSRGFKEPKSVDEVERIVRWAYDQN